MSDLLRFRGTDRHGTPRTGVVPATTPPIELLDRLIGDGWRRVILDRDGVEVGRAGVFDYTGEHVRWAEK
jgi:hypothetical protein